ncbi:hypothetical protein [Acidithiobacillus sulfuriphilus]|jgi:hypothetical protein|uniref:Uncharacterized protein n=1 Tax=Acidithiobacillus sulfuriphilus TaxID=1867749 RepID=A0ACD5HQ53_9PROT|nr:hypothetical protein [Acidithiobacillus sulfuriphilus]
MRVSRDIGNGASWRDISDAKLAEQVIASMSQSAAKHAASLTGMAKGTIGAMKNEPRHE